MKYSIYAALTLIITLTVLTIMTGHGYLMYADERDRTISDAKIQTKETLNSLTQNIVDLVESYSVHEYENLLKTEVENGGYLAILVKDRNMGSILGVDRFVTGYMHDENWNIVSFNPESPQHNQILANSFFEKSSEITSSMGESLGVLTIFNSDREIQKSLESMVYTHVVDTILISAMLILILITLLRQVVLKPVYLVQSSLEKTDDAGIPIENVAVKAPREIEELENSINTMIEAIRSSRQELEREHEILAASEHKFRHIIESTTEGYWAIDPSSLQVIEANNALCRMLGYENHEMLGKQSMVFCDEENAKVLAAHAEKISNTDYRQYEVALRHKDGFNVPAFFNACTFRDSDGHAIFAYAFISDLTTQKNIQHDLQLARDHAETANKAKSEFLASMSHELRTPLNAVLGFSQLLQYDPEHPLEKVQNEHVEAIIEGGSHLLSLVNEVLDLAKIEANQETVTLEEVSANKVVSECINLLSLTGLEDKIKIHDHFSDQDEMIIRTDKKRFKQIIINLLSNAIKYNRTNGTVIVSGYETDEGFIHISIKDTGLGISDDNRGNVFQMFHRIGDDPTIAREGTGIGLTVSKLLIDRLAGRIDFESEVGVGTTFWIELPMASNQKAIIWAENLKIGVDIIDKEHQEITESINRISFLDGNPPELSKHIDDFVILTLIHFEHEEVVMKACEYPEYASHKMQHEEMGLKIHQIASQIKESPTLQNISKLQHFLKKSWIGHVFHEDMKIKPYTSGKAHQIRQAVSETQRQTQFMVPR
ncbi:ATP-binding protein [Magnetovibrio blakemorei]|uniref:histidine kinase n=1 Tax=Magnetovibrio blakemorei TaxID=28181 RepID=A0A1E5Q361_9PROT|nr:ATP-binding protein [Magnetovibrio blakemorei]OEJ63760.1 hypothetical protein BEN30_17415 [Magnetovibrio blakemorei]